MEKQTNNKKPCDCGCQGKTGAKNSSKMRKTDKANMEQSLKDESSYLHKNLGK